MSYTPPSLIQQIKNKIIYKIDLTHKKIYNTHGGDFCKRIKIRHKTFWSSENAEVVRNTIMRVNDSVEKWKDVEHWQRKLSNKFNSREFAEMNGCRVPDLYWRGRQLETIAFENLPAHFVIRPTIGHNSRLVFLMKDRINLFDKKKYAPQDLKAVLSKALSKNPYLEFLIEEFIKNERGEYEIPDDYKISAFNGEIACIEVINRIAPKKAFCSVYDENWNKMKAVKILFPFAGFQNPPKCLNEMVQNAKDLSRAYEIFVRIDFYSTDKGCVFGEFTPTPSLGDNYTQFGEKLMISYWDKYCKDMI